MAVGAWEKKKKKKKNDEKFGIKIDSIIGDLDSPLVLIQCRQVKACLKINSIHKYFTSKEVYTICN